MSGIAIADLDGDGDTDLACAAFTQNKVYWLRNEGGFAFTPVDIATGLSGVTRVLAADYDADGDVDIATAVQTGGAYRFLRNNGSGTFANELLATGNTPRRIVNADIDQDGDTDILYAGGSGIGYFRNDAGTFTQRSLFTYNGCRGVGTADMDGDGYNDLLYTDYAEDDMSIAGYSADGNFNGMDISLDTDFDYASMISAADLDGDGDMDIVGGSDFDLRVYINDGGTFTKRPLNRILNDARGVCHGDFDNDGDTDLMAVGGLYVNWYRNDGTGKLTALIVREGTMRIQVGGGVDLKAADMDGDGDLDAVLTERAANKVSWIENLGGGNFAKHLVYTLSYAYSCDPVDFDGDGDMDVVASNLTGGFVYWYENNGSQVFTQHMVDGTYPQPYEVRALDYDNDGDMDVLSACYSNLQQVGKLVLFRNTGNGNFSSIEVDQSAPGITSAFWTDLDGDGDQDIVATMGESDRVNWYENDGNTIPWFTEHVLAYGVRFATYVVANDLDGDGDMDVVTSALDDRSTDWFENDGNQNFTRHTLAHNVYNAQFVGTGDIDGDGTPEIYASCAESEAVHLYRRTNDVLQPVTGPVPVACHDLVISEMVHQPGDMARALEIYNPRSVPVDLSGYSLRFYPNGQYTYGSAMLTGVIPAHGTHTVVAPNYTTGIGNYADQITWLWFDGSDAIALVHGNMPIDIIGKVGEFFEDDDYWNHNGVGTFYTVLVRKPTVDHGDADGTDDFHPDVEWTAYAVNDYSHLGSHTGPCDAICTPVVSIALFVTEVCAGATVDFTANVSDGGAAPAYQWFMNGVLVGSGATFTTPPLEADAQVHCTVVSNAACAPVGEVLSAPVTVHVVQVPVPVASISGPVLSASPVPGGSYQWYLDGNAIPGATAATYTATANGVYSVEGLVQGCASALSDTVLYQINTGLYEPGTTPVRLYPNPTDGMIHISSPSPVQRVRAWNALGACILDSRTPRINLSGHAAGPYAIGITVAGKEVRKVIVLR